MQFSATFYGHTHSVLCLKCSRLQISETKPTFSKTTPSSFIYEFLQLSSWMDCYCLDPPQKLHYKYRNSLRVATICHELHDFKTFLEKIIVILKVSLQWLKTTGRELIRVILTFEQPIKTSISGLSNLACKQINKSMKIRFGCQCRLLHWSPCRFLNLHNFHVWLSTSEVTSNPISIHCFSRLELVLNVENA